jgi:cellulose 1,4-beta-cellobiosidase
MLSLLTAASLCISSVFGLAGNPYEGKTVYVQQAYVEEVQTSIDAHPQQASLLKKYQNVPVFYWIDSMARIANLTTVLDGATAKGNVVVQIIIYDVPNRDCSAAASNGEITCADSACTQGIQTYETDYIDKIYAIISQSKYSKLTIVAIIEPDSLPNLATNMNVQKCQQAQTAYMTCISYAIKKLATLPNVYQYVDAAHGGWLGWPDNAQKFSQIISQVLQSAGGQQTIRGFVTNTANYQPLGSTSSTSDPCKLQENYNNCINEAIYISFLDGYMRSAGITGKAYITDTSRNGVPDCRKANAESCGDPCCEWCNIANSGFGNLPSTNVASVGNVSNIVDAFVWAKVPGESDGTSDTSASNYDFHCGSDESVPNAPQAGMWFDAFFVMLAQNAPQNEYSTPIDVFAEE